MKSFYVTAVNSRGKTVNDTIFSEDESSVKHIAAKRGLLVTSVKEIDVNTSSVKKLKTKDLVIFCQQLSTMINSGVSLLKALELVQDKTQSKKTKEVYRSLYEEVQKGNTLSLSMIAQRGVFPPYLINMIAAGEKGGTMNRSLTEMANYYEKDARLTRMIKGAAMYPAILATISVIVVIILVTVVLPSITDILPPDELPWTTAMLMSFSNFLITKWYIIILSIIGIIFGTRQLLKSNKIRYEFDKVKLKIPVVGKLLKTIYSSRVASSMSSMYSSGVSTLTMIEETSRVIGNEYLRVLFTEVYEKVGRGEKISTAIEETEAFEPMLHSMISIGEESGSLTSILQSTSKYFDEEADTATSGLVALLEPVMIVVMGVTVAFIVISIIQPIFQMYDSVG